MEEDELIRRRISSADQEEDQSIKLLNFQAMTEEQDIAVCI